MRDSHSRRAIGPWVLAGGLLVAAVLLRILANPGDEAAESSPVPSARAAGVPRDVPESLHHAPLAAGIEPAADGIQADVTAPPEPLTRTIAYAGRIVGARGEPIEGATVWLIPDSATLRATSHPLGALDGPEGPAPSMAELLAAMTPTSFPWAESDGEGRFRVAAQLLRAPPATLPGQRGRPELFARQGGSRPALHVCREAEAENGSGVPLEIDIGVLTLLPGVAVEGRAVDARFAPIAGVEVSAEAPTAHASGDRTQSAVADFARVLGAGRSNRDGRFRLEGLAESTDRPIRVRLEFPGYQEVRREIFASPGETVELGDVLIERGLAIAGRVVDERGRPLAEVPVRLTDEALDLARGDSHSVELELLLSAEDREVVGALGGRDAAFVQATTDADGRFEIGGLDAHTAYAAYASLPGREPASAVRLAAGGPAIELRLLPRASLPFVLVEAHGHRKLTDASVRVFRQLAAGNYFHSLDLPVRRDPEEPSRFVVDEVCPAKLGILIDSPSIGRHALVITGVALGAAAEPRVLEVAAGATLGGAVVLESTGAPVPDAVVTLAFSKRGEASTLLKPNEQATSDDGTFRFEGIAPGALVVSASGAGLLDASQALALAPGETRLGLTIAVRQAARFEGTVTVAGRGAAEGVAVVAKAHADAWDSVGSSRTRADGRYAVEVPAGSWVLSFSLDMPGGAVSVVESASVGAGQATSVDAELPAPARLSGLVLSVGRPVSEAAVAVSGRGVELTVIADAEGRFETEVVGCGEVALVARSPRGGISEVTWVILEPAGSAWAELRFGGRTLSGRVVDVASGEPVAQAGVLVLATGKDRPPDGSRVLTDAEGGFTCGDLSIGEFSVRAEHPEYFEAEVPLTVAPANQTSEIAIELQRANSLEGMVRGEDGEPVTTTLLVSAWERSDKPAGQVETDAEGRYRINGLPNDFYQVFVTPVLSRAPTSRQACERLSLGWSYVRIKNGADAQLDITLRPRDD